MSNLVVPALLLMDGLIGIIIAVFANDFGLDPTDTWGKGRILLFLFGMGLIIFSIFSIGAKRNFADRVLKSEFIKTAFLAAHLWAIIFAIYIWLITFGNFTTWTHTSRYYTRLSDAFHQGHLYLDINPGALVEAANPYDPGTRPRFNDEIWDMSYYDGKVYLYWGPVPSLIITPIQTYFNKRITDNQLVFWSFAFLLIVNTLIILKLWRKFYPHISAWNVFPFIPLMGLILPVLWEMNVPNVYEVGVGAGQFFLMNGIYFSISAFDRVSYVDERKLFLAGLFWVASVGSRAINALSVIFLTLLIFLWIIKRQARPIALKSIIRPMTALFSVLIIGAVAIGWYNWARFGSPLEFGIRYMITTYDLNQQGGLIFRPEYFPLNFFAYFLQPFRTVSEFPFILPTSLSDLMIQRSMESPYLYYAGRTSGILFSMPFLFLGIVALRSMRDLIEKKTDLLAPDSINWVIILLAGSSLVGLASLLFYFNAQVRFLVDIISQVTLLAIIGYWELISAWQARRSFSARIWVGLANLLLILTIAIGFLLSMTSETDRLKTLNPDLFKSINTLLGIQ